MQRKLAAVSFALILLSGCGTVNDLLFSSRDAERAMVTLTALQELRHSLANDVAEAYFAGYISVERSQKFEKLDNEFRQKWLEASNLVILWRAQGERPDGTEAAILDVTDLAVQLQAVRND